MGSELLREVVLEGRIRLLSVLMLPPLGFAALFLDVWLRFPTVVPESPNGRIGMAVLLVASLATTVVAGLTARRHWVRPARWTMAAQRFAAFECAGIAIAGPAYALVMVQQLVIQGIVLVLSLSFLGLLFFAIANLLTGSANEIAWLPASALAGTDLEILVQPYPMQKLDENMGWTERRDYRRQLELPPLFLRIGPDDLALEHDPPLFGTAVVARLSMSKVTQAAVRVVNAEYDYEPAGSDGASLTICPGTTVAITFGHLGEWVFPCPVGAANVVSLIDQRATAIRESRPQHKKP